MSHRPPDPKMSVEALRRYLRIHYPQGPMNLDAKIDSDNGWTNFAISRLLGHKAPRQVQRETTCS